MRRRDFIAFVGGVAASLPIVIAMGEHADVWPEALREHCEIAEVSFHFH
jgi:hypothetical protein